MEQCKELKKTYDDCFNSWFAERFLKGDTNDSTCASLLKVYTECIEKAMKDQQIELHDVQANHLGTEKEKVPPS
ncbi:TP53-regulated inhibitor of apoptosis 1-like isoform X2 [Copidosoma floridanum]|uniref:TP53-regulated inhibitor of apoptosis 1-like isoform X2 n=1 Tax=Copidosoma floridanum TaxID=29053 RepID=UPI0006C994A3|nr:TP53-regulated inhibitor of apoptosis 1-like isoform X2 [Copidosoma floridanum]XP_014213117.1 TP53-regulated inhibitor of apoptosis 1-like isoform X2 [Copidosoma floridanum]